MPPGAPDEEPGELTRLLDAMREGDAAAGEALLVRIYETLRVLARTQLSRERQDHTLQPTALVHDAWVRLTAGAPVAWQNRSHFFAAAARAMRRLLVDHARARRAGRRRHDLAEPLGPDLAEPTGPEAVDLIALDDALHALEQEDPRAHRVVELKYFSGLEMEEIAELLEVSAATVKRDWRFAQAWLRQRLADEPSRGESSLPEQ
jgi:RNA polymerase sigma factor (TIGR02999 family)